MQTLKIAIYGSVDDENYDFVMPLAVTDVHECIEKFRTALVNKGIFFLTDIYGRTFSVNTERCKVCDLTFTRRS